MPPLLAKMTQLQPFNKADFDTLISWADSEETLLQFAGKYFTYPLTHEQLGKYTLEAQRHIYKVVDVDKNITIGHAEICMETNGLALLCRIIIGVKSYRGKGLGQEIVKQLLAITFLQLSAISAELNVFDWNIAAIKCYEKVGFTDNPSKAFNREINGKIWKAINMKIGKEKWKDLLTN